MKPQRGCVSVDRDQSKAVSWSSEKLQVRMKHKRAGSSQVVLAEYWTRYYVKRGYVVTIAMSPTLSSADHQKIADRIESSLRLAVYTSNEKLSVVIRSGYFSWVMRRFKPSRGNLVLLSNAEYD